MEVSLLQHSRDNSPKTVSIGEVAGKLEEMQMLGAQMALKARGDSF